MKKLTLLTVLLLALGLTVGFTDTIVEPTVAASATFTAGVDLDTMAIGFTNAASSSVTITVVDEASRNSGDLEDPVYGYIDAATFKIELASVDTATAVAPSVTAKIMAKPVWIGIYSAPSIASADKVTLQDSGDTATTVSYTTSGGFAVGYDSDAIDLTVEVASEADWTATAPGGFAFEVVTALAFSPVSVDVSAAMGTFGSQDIGFSVKPALDIAAGTLAIKPYVAFDGIMANAGGFAMEVGAGAEIDLSEDGETDILVDFSYSDTTGVGADLKLTVKEGDNDDGFVPDLGVSVAVGLTDLDATLGWTVDVAGHYYLMEDKVKPSVAFGMGSDDIINLTIALLLDGMIPNTDFTLQYASADLTGTGAADLGTVTLATVITLP